MRVCVRERKHTKTLSIFFLEFHSFVEKKKNLLIFRILSSKRLDYVNHARRLAEDDWAGVDAEGEKEKEDQADEDTEEMEVELKKKLPKYYANQVCADG